MSTNMTLPPGVQQLMTAASASSSAKSAVQQVRAGQMPTVDGAVAGQEASLEALGNTDNAAQSHLQTRLQGGPTDMGLTVQDPSDASQSAGFSDQVKAYYNVLQAGLPVLDNNQAAHAAKSLHDAGLAPPF